MKTRPHGVFKRPAQIPIVLHVLDPKVSKADLWEAALSLASLCSDGDGADDEPAAIERLIAELNVIREAQARKGRLVLPRSRP